jgi:CheY-like chemotaxis protein
MNEKMPKKVMIIDDDRFLLEMQANKFQKAGIETLSFFSAEEALNKIESGENPDIMLVDLIMPKMDGFQFLAKIREKKLLPDTLKIVFSNQGQQSDIEKVRELEIEHHLIKALYTPSEVLNEVLKIYNSQK